jgi:hypothetical protein
MDKYMLLLGCTIATGAFTTIYSINVTLINDTPDEIIAYLITQAGTKNNLTIKPDETSRSINTDQLKNIELSYAYPSSAFALAMRKGLVSESQSLDLPTIISKAQGNDVLIHIQSGYTYGFSPKIEYRPPQLTEKEPIVSRPITPLEETVFTNVGQRAYKALGLDIGARPNEILGVKPDADFQEIFNAYSKLAHEWGTKFYRSSGKDQVAKKAFTIITDAYKAATKNLEK